MIPSENVERIANRRPDPGCKLEGIPPYVVGDPKELPAIANTNIKTGIPRGMKFTLRRASTILTVHAVWVISATNLPTFDSMPNLVLLGFRVCTRTSILFLGDSDLGTMMHTSAYLSKGRPVGCKE